MSALQISPEQLHTLGQAMLQRFERGCLADLRRDHPELTQPHADEVLLQFVRHGITRAAALEVTGVSDVKDWLALMLRLGSGFDVGPSVRRADGHSGPHRGAGCAAAGGCRGLVDHGRPGVPAPSGRLNASARHRGAGRHWHTGALCPGPGAGPLSP